MLFVDPTSIAAGIFGGGVQRGFRFMGKASSDDLVMAVWLLLLRFIKNGLRVV
jgi:hypothetical protein